MAGLYVAPVRASRPRQDATTSLCLPRHSYSDAASEITQNMQQPLQSHKFAAPRRLSTMRSSTSQNAPAPKFDIDDSTTRLDLPSRPQAHVTNRRPVSAILADRLAAQAAKEREELTMRGLVGKREARRRTIYVPDDTTVMTIHPASSLNSSDNRDDKAASVHQLRPVRRRSVLQKPKRRSSVMPIVEETLDLTSVIPPASNNEMEALLEEIDEEEPPEPAKKIVRPPRRRSLALMAYDRQRPVASVTKLQTLKEDSSRIAGSKRNHRSPNRAGRKALKTLPKTTANLKSAEIKITPSLKEAIAQQKRLHMQHKPMRKSIAPPLGRTLSDENVLFVVGKPKPHCVSDGSVMQALHDAPAEAAPAKLNVSAGRAVSDPKEFSIIKDDLAHPELYEENWLEHHEIALTQLLNTFFESAHNKHQRDMPFHQLRSRLMAIHNDAEVPHLQKRLQASLLFGSLKVPEDVFAKSPRLKDDVGLRRRYLNAFLDTYDLVALQAAAEVVAGREFVARASNGSVSEHDVMPHGNRRSIEQYLDHFFIQHADVSVPKTNSAAITALARDKVDQVGSNTWAWRRTIIKSLMLVLLLDKAKQEGITNGCLFQPTSCYKTSENVVKALGALLLPSYGDLMRPLKHLKYEVFVVQQPINEFDYHVDNIATDLRDGIRLTRVVEILLSNNYSATTAQQDDCKMWTLTQHLKCPCPGRPHKLQNVMAALSALVRLPSMPEKMLKDITAYDIVDGHREKTLSLLWALLGQYAMESLVDWDLVKKETQAAQEKLMREDRYAVSMEDISQVLPSSKSKCWGMLYQWAMAVAALQNVQIANLTTSFAGQAAFNAILQVYLPYLPHITNDFAISTNVPLEASLRTAGCSSAFVSLLSRPHSIIPTRDFTLTLLTFLAARLLPATRAHRAACTVQRTWRLFWSRRQVTRRVKLMRLANHCAAVVQARDRVINAAVVLQRAWRRVLDVRMSRLEREVVVFQSIAKGWLARRGVKAQSQQQRSAGITHLGRERRAGW